MKVLLISHTCASRLEGQPKARLLAQQPDLQLRVLVPDRWYHYGQWRPTQPPDPPDFDLSIEKIRCAWMGPAQWYLHWYPRLKQIFRKFQPDIIDLWEEPWGLVSAHTCRLRNTLLPATRIISETEQNIDKKLPFPFERFRSYTLRNADYAIGRNAQAIEVLRSKGFAGPAQVVPNAVDAELFKPLDRLKCRDDLGVSGFVVGYVGRLVEEKGISDLIDALDFCPDNVIILVAGSGPFEPQLRAQAHKIGKTAQVRFLGPRPLEQLPSVMNALDVLALPSRTTPRWKEQFGRVIIEAQACGIPVIGSNSGAIPEVIGRGGLIAPENDPQALAQAIRRLSEDPNFARAAGLAGREQVESRYTWQRVAEQMHDIYRRVFACKRLQSSIPRKSLARTIA